MNEFYPNFEEYLLQIKQNAAFSTFAELLRSYNEKYNLTAILEEKDVIYKHFLDSVAGEKFFFYGANVLEVGSGAGFPSIPLKILRPDLSFTLVESTGKKCEFLKIVVEKLNLKKVNVVQARAEDLAKLENYREQFDICCARAVARLNTLAEYCMPFIKVGGNFVAYKGDAIEEVNEAKNAISILGGWKTELYSFQLPEEYGGRTIVKINKKTSTPTKYPRGNGKERNKPL